MANKVITVTTASVGTSDTVASYNAYSDQDGSLGSLSVAEAASGKTFALSDGVVHSVTVKPVGTSSGEYNAPSNSVTVDLSVGEVDATLSLIDLTKSGTSYTADSPSSSWNARGLAAESITANGYAVVDIISVASVGNQLVKLRNTNVNEEYTVVEGIAVFVVGGAVYTLIAGGSGVNSGVTVAVGDRLRMIRIGTTIKAQKDVGSTGVWTDIVDFGSSTAIASGTLYPQFTAGWQAGNYNGVITNPKVYNG